jgi:hypothetical protein
MKKGVIMMKKAPALEESDVPQREKFCFSWACNFHVFTGSHGKEECAYEKFT